MPISLQADFSPPLRSIAVVMLMSLVNSPTVPGRWLSSRCVVSSLQVKCMYEGPGVQPAAAVHSARIIITPPAPLVAMGTVRVQMRIATGTLSEK